jgi:hypothetical protein
MCTNSYIIYEESYPLDVNQCPHQTTQYKFMMHYVKSGDKRRRGHLEHLAQKKKIQELSPNPSEHYLLNISSSSSVFVCVCVSPPIFFYGNGQ